jgi:hypothetical protein
MATMRYLQPPRIETCCGRSRKNTTLQPDGSSHGSGSDDARGLLRVPAFPRRLRKVGRRRDGGGCSVIRSLPDVLAKVEKWATANGCQRSRVIARPVERGLASESETAKPRRPAGKGTTGL